MIIVVKFAPFAPPIYYGTACPSHQQHPLADDGSVIDGSAHAFGTQLGLHDLDIGR